MQELNSQLEELASPDAYSIRTGGLDQICYVFHQCRLETYRDVLYSEKPIVEISEPGIF